MSDPFAAAQAGAATQNRPAQLPADPFNGAAPDLDDPFATEEDVKGGAFNPSPAIEQLNGRLVVMIPRAFRSDQPVPDDFSKEKGAVQDAYFVDMYVLGADPVAFTVIRKGKDGAPDTTENFVVPTPAAFPDKMIYQAALVGQLRRIDGGAKPILAGRIRRGPQAKDRASKTFDTIEAEYAAWMRNMAQGIKGTEPRFSWQVDVNLTPEQGQALRTWWASVRGDIAPLVKAKDITGQGR